MKENATNPMNKPHTKHMKSKKFKLPPAPRFENETDQLISRLDLQRCINHPSAIFLGEKPGRDIENEPVYTPSTPSRDTRYFYDPWLLTASYLSPDARTALIWCIAAGPMRWSHCPVHDWVKRYDWIMKMCFAVLGELRIAGHAFKVEVDGGQDTKPVTLWKFSERPCGLPAEELKNAVFSTNQPQYQTQGITALPMTYPPNRTLGFRLGHEIPRYDGILPPEANDWED